MFDIKYIRDNPQDFDAAMARRGLEAQSPEILSLDEKRRAIQTELQTIQQERNEKSKEIGKVKAAGGDAQEAMDAVSALKDKMGELEENDRNVGEQLKEILSGLPNIMKDDVPEGADEEDNVEIRRWFPVDETEPRVGESVAKEHFEIGEALGMMDFDTAAKLSGSRFVMLKGKLAKLERAIAQFMLDTHTEKNGLTEVSSPLLVTTDVMYGTGQLPKFEEDQYETTDGKWLIPTSEVTLTNTVREDIVDGETLPHRYTAFTPCFRKEAGSAGKDTRGMLRQHQFYKVEMVSITKPEESDAEHERMLGCAQGILEALEIPYRTVVLCTGDTGFGARKTYDIEAWLPGQNTYREISSCSTCGDFQARRMNARFKEKGDKKTQFVHTLNGSGVAVGRCLIAVMENYYDPADGGVFVPEVLKPYMSGLEKITK
ncbi:MAG: serine--tRNA ligase [Pseudomonadota bacterium]